MEKNQNRLLLGVTGGIASGKTTVANMIFRHGAPVIDADVIARQVVEPDKPAWKEIVAYFGKEILLKDRTLDRKKLSKIVFNDTEKRKMLERFTHPVIGVEFSRQMEELSAQNPEAIIQVVIPLLIESNMQSMFDRILIVYVPEEMQIARLSHRDNISRKEAAAIVSTQLSIEKKKEYADFVIYNEKSLEETQKQVDVLWERLLKIKADKTKAL